MCCTIRLMATVAKTDGALSRVRPPPRLKAGLDLLPAPGAAGPAAARGPGHPLPVKASRRR